MLFNLLKDNVTSCGSQKERATLNSHGLASSSSNPGNGQRGFVLFLIVVFALVLLGAYFTVERLKAQRNQMYIIDNKKHMASPKCLKAMREIITAMENDKKILGSYPYHFDDAFFNRNPRAYRDVFNTEIWTAENDHTVALDTNYGERYTITGNCMNSFTYFYDSTKGQIETYH